MKAQCSVIRCNREATHQAKFVIYPLGYPDSLPLELMAPACACDFHATEQGGVEVLNGNLEARKQIEAGMQQQGYVSPDWSRSACEWVPIEYELDLSEDRLPVSGMKPEEAVKRARLWWEAIGRKELSKRLNEASNIEEIGRTVRTGTGKTPGFVVQGDRQAVVQSGLLRGLPWEQLTRREQLEVVKTWHEHVIVNPLKGIAMQQREQ